MTYSHNGFEETCSHRSLVRPTSNRLYIASYPCHLLITAVEACTPPYVRIITCFRLDERKPTSQKERGWLDYRFAFVCAHAFLLRSCRRRRHKLTRSYRRSTALRPATKLLCMLPPKPGKDYRHATPTRLLTAKNRKSKRQLGPRVVGLIARLPFMGKEGLPQAPHRAIKKRDVGK